MLMRGSETSAVLVNGGEESLARPRWDRAKPEDVVTSTASQMGCPMLVFTVLMWVREWQEHWCLS